MEPEYLQPNDEQKEAMAKFPLRHCAPVIIGEPNGDITKNASSTLLMAGNSRLIVTNYHVIVTFRSLRKENPDVVFQVCGETFDPDERCWDCSENFDLFIIDASEIEPVRLSQNNEMPPLSYFAPSPWPAVEAQHDDGITFAGFPEVYRDKLKGGALQQKAWGVANVPVTDAFGDRFYCSLTRDQWRSLLGDDDAHIHLDKLSGMSGSPAFKIFFDNDENLQFELLGFVMGDGLPHQEKMFFTAASNLLSTGKIKNKRKR
jgi:hypothetical protein